MDSAMDYALVNIQPGELEFPFILNKPSTCTLQIKNKTESDVAFKVKTTTPKKYTVHPSSGIIKPKATLDLNLTMQALTETPPNYECKDKFLVRTVKVPEGITAKDITEEMFKRTPGKIVEDIILKAVYIPPPQTSVTHKSAEGASLLPKSTLDNVSQDVFPSDQGPKDPNIKAKDGQLPIDVMGLKEKLDQVAKEHKYLKTKYDQESHLQTNVDALKANFGQLQMDVHDLKTKFGQLQTDVGDLKAKCGGLQTDVADWKAKFGEALQKIHESKDRVLFQFLLACSAFLIGIVVGCFLRSNLSSS